MHSLSLTLKFNVSFTYPWHRWASEKKWRASKFAEMGGSSREGVRRVGTLIYSRGMSLILRWFFFYLVSGE